MARWSWLFLALGALGAVNASEDSLPVSFRPQDFPEKVAKCKAINRAAGALEEIEIHYVEVNPEAKNTLLMVHGWPSLWHSWKHQIEEFKGDYHLILPMNRGYGSSTVPGDVTTSGNLPDHVNDLVCVLDHAGVSKATCMGHDWGSVMCYQAARELPDRFHSAVTVSGTYIPWDGDFVPTDMLVSKFPHLGYQVYFAEHPDEAANELNQDIRRSLRSTLRTRHAHLPEEFLKLTDSYLGPWQGLEIPPIDLLTKDEEDYWVEQYSIQGFRNTLALYSLANQKSSWAFVHHQGNYTISQPLLTILPKNDPVGDWVAVARALKMKDYIPQLIIEVIEGSHWPQLESPRDFNRIARKWLDGVFEKLDSATAEKPHRAADEL